MAELMDPLRTFMFPTESPGHISPARVEELVAILTTTGTDESTAQLFDAEATSRIDLDDLRSNANYTGLDGSGWYVVIIDSGIDLDHPYFGPDSPNDNDTIADRIAYSWDFADNDSDASDTLGHGTLVSSIVASSSQANLGVAPGAGIIHLKVSKDGTSAPLNGAIEKALRWVADNAATYQIASVNLSLGDGNYAHFESGESISPYSDELAVLAAMNIIPVAAAGNSFGNLGSALGVAYPAADPNTIAVGSVFDDDIGTNIGALPARAFTTGPDRIVPSSQRHPVLTDILAPGSLITGAWLSGGTTSLGGTSFATPHITGLGVLAQQLATQVVGRRLTLDEFRLLLRTTGTSIVDGAQHNDSVQHDGSTYYRADADALCQAIVAMKDHEIRGKVFHDLNGDGTTEDPPGLASRYVGMSEVGANQNYADTYTTFATTHSPIAIPDLSIASSSLTVSGQIGVISSLTVSLSITHSNVEDLDAYLISPLGTIITLFNDVGGSGDNFTSATFWDEAATPIGQGTAPFTPPPSTSPYNAYFQPQEPLGRANGEVPNGTWRLVVSDDSGGATGAIVGWSLQIKAGKFGTTTDSTGNYSFRGLASGTYEIGSQFVVGWIPTYPEVIANGTHEATLPTGSVAPRYDFGYVPWTIINLIGDESLHMSRVGDYAEVRINGIIDPEFSVPFNAVRVLIINDDSQYGSGNNVIDLSGVTSANFPGFSASWIHGGSGNDSIYGTYRNDVIFGDDGDDTLTGSTGSNDFISGDDGVDTWREVAYTDNVAGTRTITLASNATLVVRHDGVIISSKTASVELVDISGGLMHDIIDASAYTSAGVVTLSGGGNGDTIIGSPGADSITALTGADSISGGGGNDTVNAGSGNDIIEGGSGNDNLNGQNGNDSVLGSDGDDVLVGGSGIDTLNGGAGNDYLSGQTDAGLLQGGDGNDTLQGNTSADTLQGNAGDDRLYGLQGADTLEGGDGADSLIGGTENDSLSGGSGTDTLQGELGNDTLDGGADFDRINEVMDSDFTINGITLSSTTVGNDTVSAIERIQLLGGAGNNKLDARFSSVPVFLGGGDGNDTLLGGAYGDGISGGEGNDVLLGGAGNDLIEGGNGTDYLLETANTNFTVSGVTITSSATGTDTTPTGIEVIVIIGGAGANSIDASAATVAVVLIGGGGNDTLTGGSGDDTLSGGNRGDSTVPGSDGTDTLDGGSGGTDKLESDSSDTLILGAGDSSVADVFALLPSWVDAL